jgi:hypothetical protein
VPNKKAARLARQFFYLLVSNPFYDDFLNQYLVALFKGRLEWNLLLQDKEPEIAAFRRG